MATDWVKELVQDVRSLGYQVPIENGVYRFYWRGNLVRLPNGQPATLHVTPHASSQARKNAVRQLIEAKVLTEDPRVRRQRQELPAAEKQALREAKERALLVKRQQQEARVAEKEQQHDAFVGRVAERLDEMAEKLCSYRHVAALLVDRNPSLFSSLNAAEQWVRVVSHRKVQLTDQGRRRLRELEGLLDWLHGQDEAKLREDYKRAESERRSAGQQRRAARVKRAESPDDLASELARFLRWLNEKVGA